VTVRLHAGGQSGTAIVRALSGGASATGDAELEILIGAAGAAANSLSATPVNLPFTGGSTTVVATVHDEGGNPLPGVPVRFSSTAGTVTPSVATTNQNGQATVTVTTTREATVTDSVLDQEASLIVTLDGEIALSITPPATITEDEPATFTITVNRTANAPPVETVRVNWGDGESTNLGAVSTSATVSHVYRRSGTFTVRATAVDANGDSVSTFTDVVVGPSLPLAVSLSASCTAGCEVREPITFTATSVAGASYTWTFGDGTGTTTTGNTATRAYTSPGVYTVVVEVTTPDRRSGRGQIQVQVVP
jgi:PKD repeat protein